MFFKNKKLLFLLCGWTCLFLYLFDKNIIFVFWFFKDFWQKEKKDFFIDNTQDLINVFLEMSNYISFWCYIPFIFWFFFDMLCNLWTKKQQFFFFFFFLLFFFEWCYVTWIVYSDLGFSTWESFTFLENKQKESYIYMIFEYLPSLSVLLKVYIWESYDFAIWVLIVLSSIWFFTQKFGWFLWLKYWRLFLYFFLFLGFYYFFTWDISVMFFNFFLFECWGLSIYFMLYLKHKKVVKNNTFKV